MANDILNNIPEVILDVLYEKGILFLVIMNNSNVEARKVQIRFSQDFKGVNGTKEMTQLPIFRQLDYLAPRKEIRIFLDIASAYFTRKEPTQIIVKILWEDEQRKPFNKVINHNLEVYKDLGYLNHLD